MHTCTHALTIIPSHDIYTHILTTCMQLIIILSMHTCTVEAMATDSLTSSGLTVNNSVSLYIITGALLIAGRSIV